MYWLRKLQEDLRIWPFQNLVLFWIVVCLLAPFARVGWQLVTGMPVTFNPLFLLAPLFLLVKGICLTQGTWEQPSALMQVLRCLAITAAGVVLLLWIVRG